jgi:cytochrome bd-type quinol oxidase subunit 1
MSRARFSRSLAGISCGAALLVGVAAWLLMREAGRQRPEPDILPLKEALQQRAAGALAAAPLAGMTLRLISRDFAADSERIKTAALEANGTAIQATANALEAAFLVRVPPEEAGAFLRKIAPDSERTAPPSAAGEMLIIEIILTAPSR